MRGLCHREGIVVPWKFVGHLLYNIVHGERVDRVHVWLWHKQRKLGSLSIETCNRSTGRPYGTWTDSWTN